jgi:isovaleryl-CoA dehydrogenase
MLKELWEKFGDLGVLGITVPEEYGGLNKGYLDHLLVMEEVRETSVWTFS